MAISKDVCIAKIAIRVAEIMQVKGYQVPDDLLGQVESRLWHDFNQLIMHDVDCIFYHVNQDGLVSTNGGLDLDHEFTFAFIPAPCGVTWEYWRDVHLRNECGDCDFRNFVRYVALKVL